MSGDLFSRLFVHVHLNFAVFNQMGQRFSGANVVASLGDVLGLEQLVPDLVAHERSLLHVLNKASHVSGVSAVFLGLFGLLDDVFKQFFMVVEREIFFLETDHQILDILHGIVDILRCAQMHDSSNHIRDIEVFLQFLKFLVQLFTMQVHLSNVLLNTVGLDFFFQ